MRRSSSPQDATESAGKTAKKTGNATITATVDGYKLKCTVSVKEIYKIKSLDMIVCKSEDSSVLLAEKKFKNISVNVPARTMKKITLRFTGSATKNRSADLRLTAPEIYFSHTMLFG